jgi:hypothetical protein
MPVVIGNSFNSFNHLNQLTHYEKIYFYRFHRPTM